MSQLDQSRVSNLGGISNAYFTSTPAYKPGSCISRLSLHIGENYTSHDNSREREREREWTRWKRKEKKRKKKWKVKCNGLIFRVEFCDRVYNDVGKSLFLRLNLCEYFTNAFHAISRSRKLYILLTTRENEWKGMKKKKRNGKWKVGERYIYPMITRESEWSKMKKKWKVKCKLYILW